MDHSATLNMTSEAEEMLPPDLSDYMLQLENDISSLNNQIKQTNAIAFINNEERDKRKSD